MEVQVFLKTSFYLLVMSVASLGAKTTSCHQSLRLPPGSHTTLQLSNFTALATAGAPGRKTKAQGTVYCTVRVSTDPGHLIVVDLLYHPSRHDGVSTASGSNGSGQDCGEDYVHVGNDQWRVDVELMTSYKFCQRRVHQELLSRGEHLWLVYKATRAPHKLQIDLGSKPPVKCAEADFPCSPVQCVPRRRVCDGVRDCSNGHDEFCHRHDAVQSVPRPLDEPCFKCQDGTCIQPRLPVYDLSHARVLWYLCDGFPHCPDAWDERNDICASLAVRQHRVGAVTECVPFDLQFGPRGVVFMWNAQCDGRVDCYHEEDEEGCGLHGQSSSGLHADPETIGIVCGLFFVILLAAVCVYRITSGSQPLARPSTSSATETLCTVCSTADSEDDNTATHQDQCCEEESPTTSAKAVRDTSV